ncbi:DUF58 domain-containing protein [Brachybacterium sp. p3-SID957]|uniref:DUF58 domain-containing protein n=1 Tax=Brachybacterium sp. p3-SID957 TaxID=2916049 RepID=UPI00223AB77D|nr:DUF58 domain-containing protein [Brachybacterium sp. p3-SID957]MCT1776018.1 DUF58 domain-containing protein [Brachybacterium sp. p3-SID957]
MTPSPGHHAPPPAQPGERTGDRAARTTTSIRPTVRAIVVAVCAVALWILADLTRVMPARVLAAALLLTLAVGGACILLSLVGLHVRRRVVEEVVPVGSRARIQAELAPKALLTTVPLGRAVLREDLPEELGGRGDLPLAHRMPHALTVTRRGTHPMGALSIVVRDVFGMFHLDRTIHDDARIIGLPVAEQIDPAAARATGIAHQGQQAAATAPGIGEIGPIARPYVAGDDIRRIHWRASARTGSLMTREDEPPVGRTALIVLDNRRSGSQPHQTGPVGRGAEQPRPVGAHAQQPRPGGAHAQQPPLAALIAAEDRLVDHAASVLAGLRSHGWEVRVVDADGDEITRAERHRAGASLLGREADAMGERASLMALADLGFDDSAPTPRQAQGGEHATGHPQVVVALGIDDGTPFDGLELDRFAGRARHRTAIALLPEAGGTGPTSTTVNGWMLVRGHVDHSLSDLLTAAGPGEAT